MTQEQLRDLGGDYQASGVFSDAEKAAIRFAEQVTHSAGYVSDSDFQTLRKHFSEEQIVEITLVSCLANFTNRFNDALHVPLDPGLSPAF